jgi:hypothetical protein
MFLAAFAGTLFALFGMPLSPQPHLDATDLASVSYAQPITGTVEVSPTVGGAIVTATTDPLATATTEVTATATLTTPVVQPTPVPIVEPEPSLQLNPFDWGYLTSPPNPPMGPFSYAVLALMLATLGVGAYFYITKRPEWKRTHSVHYRAANRFAQPAIWLGVIGLLLIIFRVVRFDFFNLRFWLYLWLLALAALVAWFLIWRRNSYPKEMAKFNKVQRQKQYMTGSGKVTTRTSKPVATTPKRSTPAAAGTGTATATPAAGAKAEGTTGVTPTTPGAEGQPGTQQGQRRRKRR